MIPAIPAIIPSDCRWLSQSGDDRPTGSAGGPGDDKPPANPYKGVGSAYVLVASVLLGLGIGWAIDNATGRSPLWTLGMTALFTVAGLYHVVRDVQK